MAPRAPRPSAALPVARTVQVAGQSIRGTETASRPSGPSNRSVLIPPSLEMVARVPVVVALTRQRLIRSGRAAVNRSVRTTVSPSSVHSTSLCSPASARSPALPPTTAHRFQRARTPRPSADGTIRSAPSAAVIVRPSSSSRNGTNAGTSCSTGAANPGSP